MNYELIKIRVLSFVYQVGTSIGVLLAGYFLSDAFAQAVTEHFGVVVGGLVSLVIPELVKHIRNLKVLEAWQAVGSDQRRGPTFI